MARMNKGGMESAIAKEPRDAKREAPAASKGGSEVGNETKANVRGTQEGGSMAEAAMNPLTGARKELERQHPHSYDDHGPHHGTTDHIRHEPLHGMHPKASHKGRD